MKKTLAIIITIIVTIIVIGIILLYMFLVEAGIALNPIKGNFLRNRALSYFSEKYNIPKNEIKVLYNDLYDKNQKCFDGCGDNTLDIKYKGNEYRIRYEIYYDTFTDNYQAEEIKRDLLTYLQEQMPYASNISIAEEDYAYSRNPDKYEGDIVPYINNFLPYSYASLDGGYRVNEEEKTLFIKVWIKADSVEEAKEKYEMYGIKTIQVLDSVQAFKDINISNSKDTQDMYSYYYLFENENYGQFVDNTKKYK